MPRFDPLNFFLYLFVIIPTCPKNPLDLILSYKHDLFSVILGGTIDRLLIRLLY